jgi:hypothetical protein
MTSFAQKPRAVDRDPYEWEKSELAAVPVQRIHVTFFPN